ncbi:hypothetical protein [Flavobacterium terrisoli]|uniref:hypothetical protein n=1 Tax=Flavobacterium terrisoli TaxID=3242195 RepID=UPI002542B333|nr:hypothetical protein [Flavobacterium buctense]
MKNLDFLINANKLILYPTVIAYLTIVGVTFAMMLQFLLGFTQLIIAIAITLRCYPFLTQKFKNLLKVYWLVVIFDLIAAYCSGNIFEFPGMFFTFILPMLIAFAFHLLIIKINKEIYLL